MKKSDVRADDAGLHTSEGAMEKAAQGVLDTLFKYTGHKPGLLPRSASGALPGTLIWTLLGAGAGRYLGAPLLRRLYPELDEDRLTRASTVLGGLAGFAPGAYLMYKTYQNAGPRGWFGGLSNLRSEPWRMTPRQAQQFRARMKPKLQRNEQTVQALEDQVKQGAAVDPRRLLKEALWNPLPTNRPVSPVWTQPSIPAGTTQNTLDTAVASGTMGVYDAANVAQIMEEARPQGSGLISPASVARAAVSYGLGSLAGRALGAVANATFANFSPGEQKNLARGVGVGNVLFDLMGRLSTP